VGDELKCYDWLQTSLEYAKYPKPRAQAGGRLLKPEVSGAGR